MAQDRTRLIEQLVTEAGQFWQRWHLKLQTEGLSPEEACNLLRTTFRTITRDDGSEDTIVQEG
jgi:hypothetical protein